MAERSAGVPPGYPPGVPGRLLLSEKYRSVLRGGFLATVKNSRSPYLTGVVRLSKVDATRGFLCG